MSRAATDMPRGHAGEIQPKLLSAGTIKGDEVCNLKNETLGTLKVGG